MAVRKDVRDAARYGGTLLALVVASTASGMAIGFNSLDGTPLRRVRATVVR